MRGRALAFALLLAGPLVGPRQLAFAREPFKKAVREPLDFRGPGRDAPEPEVADVVLGWFGPDDPAHPDYGDFWRGAAMALEDENAAGGYRGKPFRLASAWSDSPWQAGILGVTRLVFEEGAWAVVGGVDGGTTHLAEQLALKSFFLLLSPGSTDVTNERANVPWLFSLPPSDEQIAPVLAQAVEQAAAGGRFVVAAATDHDSHAALVAWHRALAARRLTPEALVEFAPLEDPALVARGVVGAQPRAVLVLAPSRAAGRLVAALRARGYAGPIVGGAPLGRNAFRRTAGAAAEGVIVPASRGIGPESLTRRYQERWGELPDQGTLCSYDAVRIVAAAVRRAGLNRARIRDAVRALAPWTGSSGVIRWNAQGRNQAPLVLGAWRGTRVATCYRPARDGDAGPRVVQR